MTITHPVTPGHIRGGAGDGAPNNCEQPALTSAGCFI